MFWYVLVMASWLMYSRFRQIWLGLVKFSYVQSGSMLQNRLVIGSAMLPAPLMFQGECVGCICSGLIRPDTLMHVMLSRLTKHHISDQSSIYRNHWVGWCGYARHMQRCQASNGWWCPQSPSTTCSSWHSALYQSQSIKDGLSHRTSDLCPFGRISWD